MLPKTVTNAIREARRTMDKEIPNLYDQYEVKKVLDRIENEAWNRTYHTLRIKNGVEEKMILHALYSDEILLLRKHCSLLEHLCNTGWKIPRISLKRDGTKVQVGTITERVVAFKDDIDFELNDRCTPDLVKAARVFLQRLSSEKFKDKQGDELSRDEKKEVFTKMDVIMRFAWFHAIGGACHVIDADNYDYISELTPETAQRFISSGIYREGDPRVPEENKLSPVKLPDSVRYIIEHDRQQEVRAAWKDR